MGKVVEKECLYGNSQYLFIGNAPIPFVQSFNANYTNPSNNSSFLGERTSYPLPNGQNRGQVSISTLLLSQDNFYPLTGNVGSNGFLIKDLNDRFNDNFGFVSGYLTSYSQSYSIDSVPSINVSFEVYRELGNINSDTYNQGLVNEIDSLSYTSTGIIKDSVLGGCFIDFTDIDSCPLLSYSINISTPRNAYYPINKRFPSDIFLSDSANITVAFQLERSSLNFPKTLDYPAVQNLKSFSISLLDKNNVSYNSYNFTNMILDNLAFGSSIESPDLVTVVYRKKLV